MAFGDCPQFSLLKEKYGELQGKMRQIMGGNMKLTCI